MENKKYEISNEVSLVAQKVLKNDRNKICEDYHDIKVIYMKNHPQISKTVAGQCIRPGRLLKHFSDSEVIIQVSANLWNVLNDEAKYVLMLHEMKHVGIKYRKDGSKIIYLKNHDIQDFSDIIEKYGINWLNSIKESTANIYGFENGEEKLVRL